MGVGILKFRLYEIDRLISRTLSYAILTGLLAGCSLGSFAGTRCCLLFSGHRRRFHPRRGRALHPVAARVQRLVDRRFNRARYDAQATVSAFGGRLRDALELETVQAELEAAVARTVQPAHVSLWIRPQSSTRT